ncbi:MAG: T9SS type A sorting domain-containing protein [Saprospiraceae bacterium]
MQAILGFITLDNNDTLTSLQGLAHINPQAISGISIENSVQLSDCAVESICVYLADGGIASVSENATGCNSVEEIRAACLVAIDDPIDESGILFYPNPSFGKIDIKGLPLENVLIRMTDSKGMKISVWKYSGESIDISNLTPGIYFMSIQTNNQIIVRRIIKS